VHLNATADYEALARTVTDTTFVEIVSDAIAHAYRAATADAALVEIELDGLTYLFDLSTNRTVAVYGRSQPTTLPRPTARLRGHPSYNRPGQAPTDRGHLAAHTIGGTTDLNLVAQDHALNLSREWRAFERYGQAHPGTPFAVEACYAAASDRPSAFTYLQLRDGQLIYSRFDNASRDDGGSAPTLTT
jgi:hypothetical protein